MNRSLLTAALCSFVFSSFAQDYRASMLGTVVDPSKAPIPSATIKATKEDTNVSRETQTSQSGLDTLVGLEPGTYTISVTAPGFQTQRRTGIILLTNDKLSMNFALGVGSIAQEITVVGEQELITTSTVSRGLVFDAVKVQEIPLNGRQAYMLMRLSPGVMFTQRTFGSTGFSGTRAWDVNGSFVMNGGRTGTNQFLLNGAPISTDGTFNLAPNVEAVQEMKIMVNTYDSQYGRTGGGHVSTRSSRGRTSGTEPCSSSGATASSMRTRGRTTRSASDVGFEINTSSAARSADRSARTAISYSFHSKAGASACHFLRTSAFLRWRSATVTSATSSRRARPASFASTIR